MATKQDLQDWVQAALKKRGGSAPIVDVAKELWREHEADLRKSGDLFYTWQYDMRWAANRLRGRGLMKSVAATPPHRWELASGA